MNDQQDGADTRRALATRRWRALAQDPGLLCALFLAFACLVGAWEYGRRFPGDDFYLHHSLARAARTPGPEELWTLAGRTRAGDQMTERAQATSVGSELRRMASQNRVPLAIATPVLVAAFTVGTSDDYAADWPRYQALCLLCTLLACAAFGRAVGLGLAGTLGALCACTAFYEPFRSALRTGNVSQLQLGGLALCTLLGAGRAAWRSVAAGAVLGALVLFKPNLLLAAALLLLSRIAARDWPRLQRELLGLGGGALLVAAAAWLRLGAFGWVGWWHALAEFLAQPPGLNAGNYALTLLVPEGGRALGVAGALLAAWLAWRQGRARAGQAAEPCDDLRSLGLGAAAMLLTAPVAWLHYDTLQWPLLFVALRPSTAPGLWPVLRRLAALCALTLGAIHPFLCLAPITDPTVFAALSRGGTACLLLAALLDAPQPDAGDSGR